jgi:methionyl-tRNA formyltransferase
VRICVAATPAVAIPTLDALLASDHDLVSVITRPDAPAGRGRTLQSTPVAQWADANGIKVYKPESKEAIGELVDESDLVITIGFGMLIPPQVLQLPKFGFINLHFSLLPRWRGAAPVQRAIEAGDSVTGVTVFKLDEGMDTGPIYQSAQIPLPVDAASEELFKSLAKLGVDPVLKAVEQISRGEEPVAQVEIGVSRAHKLSKEEGRIDWQSDAAVILRKVNAFHPNPGAWATFRGDILKINSVRTSSKSLPVGVIEISDKSVFVGTSTTALEIVMVTPAGKAQMVAQSWANGARLTSSDTLV